MPFKPLLEIRVEHPFYASGLCAAARVSAEPATGARVRGLRLLAREAPGRLTLIADFTEAGEARVAIPDSTLRFGLFLDPSLHPATDLSACPPGTLYVDSGAGKKMKPTLPETRAAETLRKPVGKAALVLSGRPRPGTKASDFEVPSPAGVSVTAFDEPSRRVTLDGPEGAVMLDYPVAPPASEAIAAIEVPLSPAAAAKAAAGTPATFTIALDAASAPWCYHLVTDLANPLAEWRIDHPASDGPPATFGAAGRSEVASGDPADPFGSALLERSAPWRVLRFVSDAPVPCSEALIRRMTLSAGDRQLFPALPNPSPSDVRLLKGKPAFGETLRFVSA